MSTITMTMIGMYNVDQTLFDNMILPDELDRELVINSILMRSGEFEVLYPDVDFMKLSIGVWSRKWNRTFVDWVKGKEVTWNPIENYDRYEDSSDSYTKTGSEESSGSETSSGSSSGTDSFGGGGSTESLVSAYDASTYQPSGKTETSTENSSESSSETSASSTSSGSVTESETSSNTHTSHIHGNIGVTQASDMLKAFYDISAWNIYEHIADVFVTEYCIPIY